MNQFVKSTSQSNLHKINALLLRRIFINLLLAIISAILLIISWPQSTFNFLLLLAFVPVLIVCFKQEKVWYAIGYFYLTMLMFIGESQSTVMAQGEYIGPLIVGIVILPLIWSIPIGLAIWIKNKMGLVPALLLFPFIYLIHEILEYYWDFAVTWFQLGLGVSNNSFFHGIYPLLGLEGTGLLIIGFNVSMVHIYFKWQNQKRKWKLFIPSIGILLLFLITFIAAPTPSPESTIRVAIYQPSSKRIESLENDLTAQIESLESEINEIDLTNVDLLVCPESYFFDMEKRPLIVNELPLHPAIQKLQTISDEKEVAILSGAILVQLYRAKKPPTPSAKLMRDGVYFDIYNGSIFITPKSPPNWRTKQTLVPFSENIPFHKFFNWLESKGIWSARYDDTYGIVPFSGTYNYKDLKIAPGICFESLFPHIMADYVGSDANLQVILSTKWTESKSVMNQHDDHMSVNVKSFGRPLLFVSTDQTTSFHDHSGVRNAENNTLVIMDIPVYGYNTFYRVIAKKPWFWWVITVIIGFFVRRKALSH